jgi:hypothetical protein
MNVNELLILLLGVCAITLVITGLLFALNLVRMRDVNRRIVSERIAMARQQDSKARALAKPPPNRPDVLGYKKRQVSGNAE